MPAAQPHWRIGEAAARSGVSTANIRYYEREKLLSPPGRSTNSYRVYSDEDVHRLRFIRLLRTMDLSLDEVRTLLALDLRDKGDCVRATAALDEHLGHVRQRLAELRVLERELKALRDCCDGQGLHCHLIEALHARADAAPRDTSAAPRRHV
jgi:DNA-binding transcriptional MerR regulator